MKINRTKKKIIRALKDNGEVKFKAYCCLLIIPFCSKEEAEKPEFKKYARNLLEVDDDFYDDILEDYKDYKNEKGKEIK